MSINSTKYMQDLTQWGVELRCVDMMKETVMMVSTVSKEKYTTNHQTQESRL